MCAYWKALLNKIHGTSPIKLIIICFVTFTLFLSTLTFSFKMTSTTEFCVSCHEMSWLFEEYQTTLHYNNRSGIRASCSDCHIPNAEGFSSWVDKSFVKIKAFKDIWYHVLGKLETKQSLETYRLGLAHIVWEDMKSRNSKECRNCHSIEVLATESKNHTQKDVNCIICHLKGKEIAHKRPWQK